MTQIFHPNMNALSKFSLFGAVFLLGGLGFVVDKVNRSPWVTQVNVAVEQPVPFSHKHHAGNLGIDCRYCHTSVEDSRFAGIPPSKTCMTCHSVLFTETDMLEPVRESYRTDKPIEWTKVHDLPDYVYFNHSIHLAKGVGCVSCHGQVDEMPLMWRENTLNMDWCLNCHRNPADHIRPDDAVFDMNWKPTPADVAHGKAFAEGLNTQELTSCSVCHR